MIRQESGESSAPVRKDSKGEGYARVGKLSSHRARDTASVDSSIVAFASVRNSAATSSPSFGDWVDFKSQKELGTTYPDDVVPAMIEVTKGSPNKYEVEKDNGQLMLDRVLHSAVYYPGDYGYIPQTLCGDGDPLDIILVGDSCGSYCGLSPGIMVNCRVLGLMDMEDESGHDEKLIAVIDNQKSLDHMTTLDHVPEHMRQEIHHFFENYKLLEIKNGKQKWARVLGWGDKARAMEVVAESRASYEKKTGGKATTLHPFVQRPVCPSMLHVKLEHEAPNEWISYVNVSKGDQNSYAYRHDTSYRHFKYALDMPYPGDYAWLCRTWQKDERKPLETLILSTFAVEAESLVDIRIIGALERTFKSRSGKDRKDVKIIAVQLHDPRTASIQDLSSVNPNAIKHFSQFFVHSAEMAECTDCKIVRTIPAAEAADIVKKAHEDYNESFSAKEICNAPNLWCMPWSKDSSQGPSNKRVFPAVVETKKHATNRYEFDPEPGVLKCMGPLRTASLYPANGGFIPQTVAEDGHPVDVMILSSLPLEARSVVEIRLVGAAECVDEMGPDIKLLGVPKSEPRMKEWDSIEQVPKHLKDEMVQFLNSHKDLEEDWMFCRFERWLDSDDAVKYVQGAHSRFFLFTLPMQRLEKRVKELELENMQLKK